MISSLTLSLFLKLLSLSCKTSVWPFYYDNVAHKVKSVTGKRRRRWIHWMICIHIFGNIHMFVMLYREFFEDYKVGLLLQDLVVPMGYIMYILMAAQFTYYETEMRTLINQLLEINTKFSKFNQAKIFSFIDSGAKNHLLFFLLYFTSKEKIFWISKKERDGLELLLTSFLQNTLSIALLRLPMLATFDNFNNLYAFYKRKGFPDSLFLRCSYYIWDSYTLTLIIMSANVSSIIFFMILNSEMIWCKKMM